MVWVMPYIMVSVCTAYYYFFLIETTDNEEIKLLEEFCIMFDVTQVICCTEQSSRLSSDNDFKK